MCGKYDGLEGHSHPRLTSRRSILRFGAVGIGAALLGGCIGGNDDDDPTPTAAAAIGGSTSVPTTAATTAATAAATATATSTGSASANALAATQSFIAGLSAAQKTAVVADRTQANLSNWSNLPEQIYKRSGVRMDGLSADQRKSALAVLEAVLSTEGYAQVNEITTADGVLANSGGNNLGFGADIYYIRFVGTPSATTPWTIQYGGHHLALNVTIVGSKMTMAPTLWGSQPALYSLNGKNFEPLGGETNKAFTLLTSLDGTQQSAAVLSISKSDLVLGAGQDGKTVAAAGVKSSTFNTAQKQALLGLVQEWLRPLNGDAVAARMAIAESEIEKMTFAWSGATAVGSAIYYRVQSPTAVMEFSHQGQGSDGVNHIHSIYREIGNDYGVGLGA